MKSNAAAINSFPAFIYQQAAGIVAPEMNPVLAAVSTQRKCCWTGVGTDVQRSLVREGRDDAGFGGFPLEQMLDFGSSTTSCYERALTSTNMLTYMEPRSWLSSDRPATEIVPVRVLEGVTVETSGHSLSHPKRWCF